MWCWCFPNKEIIYFNSCGLVLGIPQKSFYSRDDRAGMYPVERSTVVCLDCKITCSNSIEVFAETREDMHYMLK